MTRDPDMHMLSDVQYKRYLRRLRAGRLRNRIVTYLPLIVAGLLALDESLSIWGTVHGWH